MVKNNIVQDQIINLMRLFPRHYQKMIKINVDIMNDVDANTNHIQYRSFNEKINGRTEWFKVECIQTCLSTISSVIGDLQ